MVLFNFLIIFPRMQVCWSDSGRT